MPLSGERWAPASDVDPFSKDFFLVPKPQLFASIVGTFRSFGLLDAFGLDAGALVGFVREVCALVGPDTTYPPLPRPPPRSPVPRAFNFCLVFQPKHDVSCNVWGMRKVHVRRPLSRRKVGNGCCQRSTSFHLTSV